MAGIDIRSLAGNAFDLAKSLTPQAFGTVTLRLSPTVTVDVSSDSEVTTWASETSVDALGYSLDNSRDETSPEGTLKEFLIKIADLPEGSRIAQDGEVEDALGSTWEIWKVEIDPTESVVTFATRLISGSVGITPTPSSPFSDGFDAGFGA